MALTILGVLACIALVIAVVALIRSDGSRLPQWWLIASSLVLMTMVTIVGALSFSHLKDSFSWRKHTYEVLQASHVMLADIFDVQRGMRGYVLTGKPESLETYRRAVIRAPQQLTYLTQLTRDNPSQQRRLEDIATDLARMLDYSRRLLSVRDSQGLQSAIDVESSGAGLTVVNTELAHLQAFADTERRLLVERDARANGELQRTAFLVFVSIVTVAALLVVANANRGIRRRRRADIHLQGVLAMQAAILKSASYAIVSTTTDGAIVSFNNTAERWLGYSAEEVIGRPLVSLWYDGGAIAARAEVLSPEFRRAAAPSFEDLIAEARSNQGDEGEWTLMRKDRTGIPTGISMTAIRNDKGDMTGYLGVISDWTERRKRNNDLRRSEERYRMLVEGIVDHAIYHVDLQGCVMTWNRGAQRLHGYTADEIIGQHFSCCYTPEDRALGKPASALETVKRMGSYSDEGWRLRKDGSRFWAAVVIHALRDDQGVLIGFAKVTQDVTYRHELEGIKSEFVATVSHELRTPLTSIRGALGLINGGAFGSIPEKAQAMIKIAFNNSERLVRIINDILDVEKMATGNFNLDIQDVPIAAFLEQALEGNRAYGEKYKVRFVLERAPANAWVLADPDRLMQVLSNLLSNAAKFSPAGGEVLVRAMSIAEDRLRVEVQDHGTGIPDAFRSRVFEKFAQADSTTTRRFEGTGLGLSIARELVQAMGGTIGFTSVLGEGACFYFEIPQHVADAHDALAETAQRLALPSKRPAGESSLPQILYIEDDVDLVKVIQASLAGRAQIVTAPTVREARRLLDEKSFSLIILDPVLPDGNALALLDTLPETAARSAPVIILSAQEVPPEIQRHVAVSLVKSRISEENIVRTILSYIDSGRETPV